MGKRKNIPQQEKGDLKALIKELRREVRLCCNPTNAMSAENFSSFSDYLAEITPYKHDKDKYPPLVFMGPEEYSLGEEPETLAQLYIWKRGDWSKFENFVGYYLDRDLDEPPKKGAVNFAFAHHLKSRGKLPIFDQHSARALWAIMGNSRPKWRNYQDYLFYKPTHWRTESEYLQVYLQASCYRDFLEDMEYLAGGCDDLVSQYAAADKLLMPLGKAIKEHVKDLDNFEKLCGF